MLEAATIRRKLAALSSLSCYLCENNAVAQNPTHGVKRPAVECHEAKTPALSDAQARALLDAPSLGTLKGQRDRAILSILLFLGLRREEVMLLFAMGIQATVNQKHLMRLDPPLFGSVSSNQMKPYRSHLQT